MDQAPKPGPEKTIEEMITELDIQLEAIDAEIVGTENIPQVRLRELTLKKDIIARRLAKIKGEIIDDRHTKKYNAEEDKKF